jgi:hypothetical protein
MKYVELPDYGDNPYAWPGLTFRSGGTIWLSWWGSDQLQAVKDWRAVTVHTRNCASTRTVQVYYEVDRSGMYQSLGTVSDSRPVHTFAFAATVAETKVVKVGSTTTTIEIDTALGASTGDLHAGDWVRINDEVRQIDAITDADTFTLLLALSAAPAAGDRVYGSAPAGHELRIVLGLSTQDDANSPAVLGVVVYCDANVADRWEWTLAVRVEDRMSCLDGAAYPMDAATLEAALRDWIERVTAFTLHDLRGLSYTVKVSNAVESQTTRRNEAPAGYDSVIRLGLAEVQVG